ncbi:hypothetical protein [Sporosarcina sp. UB5]|uniref:hypothetical protein n=1 Tax=Sporosarcina sp. UB5 TaxID=3047463 RepID=UPI003D7A9173
MRIRARGRLYERWSGFTSANLILRALEQIYERRNKFTSAHTTLRALERIYERTHNFTSALANESSTTKQKLATQGIRRGKLAQILVSMHEGKPVSEAAAINFLIKNKITSAKTVQEYNANQILTRAQVSAFLQRHEQFVASQKVRY